MQSFNNILDSLGNNWKVIDLEELILVIRLAYIINTENVELLSVHIQF